MPEPITIEQVETDESTSTPVAPRATGSFLRHIAVYSASNLFYLVVTTATTFVVPKWLSIEGFAMYRYFLLFGGFAGALHLGSLDGALMQWVEDPAQNLRRGWMPLVQCMLALHVVVLLLGTVAVCLLTHGTTQSTWLMILVLLPVANALALGQYALQSVRRFSTLSALTAILPLGTLSVVVILHTLHRASGPTVIGAYLLSNAVIATAGILALKPNVSWTPVSLTEALRVGRDYIALGWSVLVFNLLANFIGSADRFFIVARFSTYDFAMYSFAGAVFYSIFLVMLSASKVVFPYLAGAAESSRKVPYASIREALLTLWALSLTFYFPICSVIRRFLPRYDDSLPLVRLLLLATAAIMLIQLLHANYFRLLRKQRSMTLAAIAGGAVTVACLVAAQRLHQLSAMAVATVVGCTVWCAIGELLLARAMQTSAIPLLRTLAALAAFMAIFLYASAARHTLLTGAVLQLTLTPLAAILIFWPTMQTLRSTLLARTRRSA